MPEIHFKIVCVYMVVVLSVYMKFGFVCVCVCVLS